MIPVCKAARPLVRSPAELLPEGSIDCHFHVFGPTEHYPYAPGRSYTPPDAPLSAYESMAASFGISAAVIIQPSVYGLDNSRTLDAMRKSRLPMRAVLVLDPAIAEEDIAELHRVGVRGVRLNLLFGAGVALAAAERLAEKIRPFAWHIQFLADVSRLEDIRGLAERTGVPLVFDHLGHVPTAEGTAAPGFRDLLALLREGRAWAKLSGPYRTTVEARPPYIDTRRFAEALIEANPAQLVWGTDWPHPSIPVSMPDDTDLLETALGWLPDAGLRKQVLVENPRRLYGF